MADKRVSDLPRATELGDNDLLVVEQAGEAKALPGAKIKSSPTDEQVAAAVEAYLAKNPPQAVTPSEALALVRQLLGKAVYTKDVSGVLAALDALLGGGELPDEWSVIAELTEADLVVGHGWSVSYPYYEVRSTRTSGTGLNLNVPITAGTYRFEFAAAADVQMSAVVYNQDAKAAMQIDGDWSRDDMVQTGWAASGVELVVPETINGTAPAGLILTFRREDESDVYQGMIHGITVSRYIAADEPDEPVVPPEEPIEELMAPVLFGTAENSNATYPDRTTFEYTVLEGSAGANYKGGWIFEAPETTGGTLVIDFDENRISGAFRCMVWLLNADGTAYKILTPATSNSLTAGVSGDYSYNMVDPGSAAVWALVTDQLRVAIPEGKKPIVICLTNAEYTKILDESLIDSANANRMYHLVDAVLAGEVVTAKIVTEG